MMNEKELKTFNKEFAISNSIYRKARASKTVVTFFWILFGLLFFGGITLANTFISNTGDSTFSSNIKMDANTNITADRINEVLYAEATEVATVQANCPLGEWCEIVVKPNTYEWGAYEITPRNKTIYSGYGVTINRNTNNRIFSHNSGSVQDIIIRGFTIYDSVNDSSNNIFHFQSGKFNNVKIYDNSFYGIDTNSTSPPMIFGWLTTNNASSNLIIRDNECNGFKKCLSMVGNRFNVINNVFISGVFSGTEGEGLDWNYGEIGSIEGNEIYNFTEQGIDVNADRVRIVNNYVKIKDDGLTTHGIHSFGNDGGVVMGNIVVLSGETADFGISIRNSNFGGQTITGNTVFSPEGSGTGIWLKNSNYSTISSNTLSNLTVGIEIDGSHNEVGQNTFNNVGTKIVNDGTDNINVVYELPFKIVRENNIPDAMEKTFFPPYVYTNKKNIAIAKVTWADVSGKNGELTIHLSEDTGLCDYEKWYNLRVQGTNIEVRNETTFGNCQESSINLSYIDEGDNAISFYVNSESGKYFRIDGEYVGVTGINVDWAVTEDS